MEEKTRFHPAGMQNSHRHGAVNNHTPCNGTQNGERLTANGLPYAAATPTGPPAYLPAVVGYTSGSESGAAGAEELNQQAAAIVGECQRRGLVLLEIVREREPANGKGSGRPGLEYALNRISAGQAQGLVVAELSRMTRSAAELGAIIEWLTHANSRLVAVASALDTGSKDGRVAAQVLVEVSRWERTRLRERTRSGLEAARRRGRSTGRPSVTDNPDLTARIAQMRTEGMTLQAIADRLNEDGVPTVRGGSKWRHSSVQAAAGYRRRPQLLSNKQFLTSTQPNKRGVQHPNTPPNKRGVQHPNTPAPTGAF